MVSQASYRGHVLEEVLAFLIRNAGYRLLVDPLQGEQLEHGRNGLVVVGRGGAHQVDVLGQLSWVPAFTFPIRLFVEAKFYSRTPIGLPAVRNAIGVVEDLNQYSAPPSSPTGPMSQRFNYRYALFSTSGFTDEASGLALAHQISLIDLSGPDFADLRRLVRSLADALFERGRDVERPVRAMRMLVRRELGTWPDGFGRGLYENDASWGLLDGSVEGLFGELRSLGELFIGMANGPFLLLLQASDPQRFVDRMRQRQGDTVAIHWSYRERSGRQWTIVPSDQETAYSLSFGLPEPLAQWIFAVQEEAVKRALDVKARYFSDITVYRYVDGQSQLYRLAYDAERMEQTIRRGPIY
jgi:hypothetical protein